MESNQTCQGDASTAKARALSSAGMIMRQAEPLNLEMPFDQVDSYLTPAEQFYVRCHFAQPDLQAATYELRVDGSVRNPLVLRYEELREMPAETRFATLECAGNSRVFLSPQREGAQWQLGAVGNAEWTGVPIRNILERAQLVAEACEIILEGADQGTPTEKPIPPGKISYARSLTRQKALGPEVLLVYRMNGRDLPRSHGYPVRAIVPGHYGMASVKWLTHIEAVAQPFRGYWQTSDYAYWDYINGKPVRRPLSEIALKSEIARPRLHETIPPAEVYTIRGAAWAGESEAAEICVSTDGGLTWHEGEFIDPVQRYAWRRWKLEWLTPARPGAYTLMARARDSTGRVQPQKHDEAFSGYAICHTLPVEVFIQ